MLVLVEKFEAGNEGHMGILLFFILFHFGAGIGLSCFPVHKRESKRGRRKAAHISQEVLIQIEMVDLSEQLRKRITLSGVVQDCFSGLSAAEGPDQPLGVKLSPRGNSWDYQSHGTIVNKQVFLGGLSQGGEGIKLGLKGPH